LWREGEVLRYVRGLVNHLPYVASTYRNAAAILACCPHTVQTLPAAARDRVIDVGPEVGFDAERFRPPEKKPPHERLMFLFVGGLVPFKCAHLAVEAFGASSELRRHRLLIVGEGPERRRLVEMVRTLRLESCVEFLGVVPQERVAELMRTSDVFVFPSIRDAGAGVVIEAMASGLPCVVADHGGPASLVTPQSGVKLPLGTRDEMVQSLVRELERLAEDPALRHRLGEAARQRASDYFTWESKARSIIEIYRWVLGQRPDKPVWELGH
jgi:glycosyltransferase involved in cell wall biosynthesis